MLAVDTTKDEVFLAGKGGEPSMLRVELAILLQPRAGTITVWVGEPSISGKSEESEDKEAKQYCFSYSATESDVNAAAQPERVVRATTKQQQVLHYVGTRHILENSVEAHVYEVNVAGGGGGSAPQFVRVYVG